MNDDHHTSIYLQLNDYNLILEQSMTLYECLRRCTGMCNDSRVTCMKDYERWLCHKYDVNYMIMQNNMTMMKRVIINGTVESCMGIHYKKNTLPWWYVFVTVGRVFCHACTSMTNLWQNQDSHTCAVVEVFHDITKIIITEVSTSMTINRASQKCFRQGWPTRGIHHNGTLLSYRVRFWIR